MKKVVQDLLDFHVQFALSYHGHPRALPMELAVLRSNRLHEEVREYDEAVAAGDLVGQLDALVDLIYIAAGTAHLHGFDRFATAWDRVHAANMKKRRAKRDGSDSRHGSAYDIIKPPGWEAPNLDDLVQPRPETAPLRARRRGIGEVIILEGADSSGKTTLAGALVSLLAKGQRAVRVVHHGPYPGEADLAARYFDSMQREPGELVILDRSWLSEPIYGRALRHGVTRITHTQQQWLEGVAQNAGAIVILCDPGPSRADAALAARGDDLIPSHLLAGIRSQYDFRTFVAGTSLPVVEYDWTRDTPERLLAKCAAVVQG